MKGQLAVRKSVNFRRLKKKTLKMKYVYISGIIDIPLAWMLWN